MLESLDTSDFNLLKSYFDNYCKVIYKREYPFTLNNVKKYFEQVVLYFFEENDTEVEENSKFSWSESSDLICNIPVLYSEEKDSTLFIRNNRVFSDYIMQSLYDAIN